MWLKVPGAADRDRYVLASRLIELLAVENSANPGTYQIIAYVTGLGTETIVLKAGYASLADAKSALTGFIESAGIVDPASVLGA